MSRRTIARRVESAGAGLHSGAEVRLALLPAASGEGIAFVRTDLADRPRIPALLGQVAATERRTALEAGGHRVDTVEHLLAAVYALGIDDLIVEVDGPELPILDGSFAAFVTLLDDAGAAPRSGGSRRAVLPGPLELTEGEARYRVLPAERFAVDVSLEYAAAVIGRQRVSCTVDPGSFRREIAAARTFGFVDEVAPLRAKGLLGGATLDCAILASEEAVLNTTLRWPDEFARHKAGDLIGDLALLGARLEARVEAIRPSHRGNIACARAIATVARFLED